MILSASRRTDIPAFYADWFVNRMREGFVYVPNPFNANQVSKIPLTTDVVDCVVFWTKNAIPIMKHLPEISRYYNNAFYFQYTINAYEKDIEPTVPDLDKRIESFIQIGEMYGKERVIWRYDPIFISDKYTLEWHIASFNRICNAMKGYTDTCVISFLDVYDKIKKNLDILGIRKPDVREMNQLAEAFSGIAKECNITIRTCAENIDLNRYGIMPNSCIDKTRIEKVSGYEIKAKQDKQREDCQCIECADIGQYNTCMHGCRYCYANYSDERVKKAVMSHSAEGRTLIGTVPEHAQITEYGKAKSLRVGKLNTTEQMSLF